MDVQGSGASFRDSGFGGDFGSIGLYSWAAGLLALLWTRSFGFGVDSRWGT